MDAPAMTSSHLTEYVFPTLQVGAWLAAGTLVGVFHFLTLQWNVSVLVTGRGQLRAIVFQLGRLALVAGILAVVAGHLGALPLLSASTGILTARAAILRWGVPS
jgi:hypothetical protein